MKKIQKIITILSVMTLVFVTRTITVFAGTGSVSINAPTTVTAGESFTITVSYSSTGKAYWEISVTSDFNVSGFIEDNNGFAGTQSGSKSYTTSISTPGTYQVNADGTGSVDFDSNEFYGGARASKTITVVEKPKEPEKPTDPEKPTTPTNPTNPTTPEEVESALISAIEITSMSSKQKGEKLTSLAVALDKKEVAYDLPERIDSFSINAVKASEGATLTYDKEYKFSEGEKSKVITITATEKNYNQTYKVTVNKTESSNIEISVNGKNMNVYEDTRLDDFAKNHGLEKKSVQVNGKNMNYFAAGKTKLLLVSNQEKDAKWIALDENNNVIENATVWFSSNQNVIIILKANDDVTAKKLNGKSYSTLELSVSDEISAIDSELKFSVSADGWAYNEGYVVRGITSDGIEDYYYINPTKGSITLAVVSFDTNTSSGMLPWIVAGVSTVIMLATTVSFVVYTMNEKKKRQLV